MKRIPLLPTVLAREISLIGLIVACALSIVQAEPPASSFGVWAKGVTFDPTDYPFVRGWTADLPWSDVEREPGVFDWSGLDQAIDKAFQNGMYLYASLGVGPEAPDWIYEHGVPKVFTDDTKHLGKWEYYPYYLAPEYKSYFQRLVTEFGKRIRSYPEEKQKRIAFIQVKTGCTGDEAAYKGEPKDSRYALSKESAEWRQFRLETFALFVKIFVDGPGPRIDLLFNSVGTVEEGGKDFSQEWDWVTTHIQGSFGIKNGALSRGHHLCGERSLDDQWTPFLIDPKGLQLFRRSEMDQTWLRPWYQLNLPLNFYWGAVNALNGGQSVWDVTKSAMDACKQEGFDYSFYFFNRYAGQIHPETATDAFCALHKGLDAADAKAYPEEKFGKATRENLDRMLKICEGFSKYGAAVDDKDALLLNQVRQRPQQRGFNDVGWDIWPDNYTRFLYQIDADETSIPLWRVGGPITKSSSIYSRFARGFEHASGKDAMYFKLHDNFIKDNTPKVMTIHVVWYDGQTGSTWKLDYDAGAPTMKTALAVTGTGDKQWHDETVALNDAVLYHGESNGGDIALINTDDKDDVFSIIEVHRGMLEEPYRKPPAIRPATDSEPAPGKAERQKRERNKSRKDAAE
ncbi:MAG: beta-galactosidase [Candidatus Sumerlaeota bacterium]|nr:beta-galactosidase [Candidatus Sumerlaeota bacterium]